MFNVYDVSIIPIIFEMFKAKKIISSGLNNKEIFKEIKSYCDSIGGEHIAINIDSSFGYDFIKGNSLEILKDIEDYDIIFLNDDPNWYTVFNELNIVSKNNNEFPLVFLCNNIFPYKRRDAYLTPNCIPSSFINEYSDKLDIGNGILINDGFYHALHDNTPKNGVLTAIEDFLYENKNINVMDLKLTYGITILFPSNNLSKIRIDKIKEHAKNIPIYNKELTDIHAENQILKKYIHDNELTANNNLSELKLEITEKDNLINAYENKLKQNNYEISYKNSRLNNLDSKVNLKQSQINNIESKLFNKELEIENITDKLQDANAEISNLKNKLLNSKIINNKEKEFDIQLKDMQTLINQKDSQLLIKNEEIKEKEFNLNSIKNQNNIQLSELHTKDYCIKCFKEEINNNKVELQYYKKSGLLKKILAPLGYIYLILKSNFNELSLNIKLYRLLKNSDCFDIGYYLKNNKDLMNSKWCKYFSPELHYVCHGFDENREFNKKYFNRNSKLELVDYLFKCNK